MDGFTRAAIEDGIGNKSVPGGEISLRHFVKHPASVVSESGFGVHVEGTAGDEDVGDETVLVGKGVQLETGDGEAEGGGGLEKEWESEVVGRDGRAPHGGEEVEGGEEVGVMDGARDEGGEGDNRGVRDEGENGEGGAEVVELGVHEDEVVGEEGGDGV